MRERIDPAWASDERSMLTAFLDYQRATVVHKVTGLSDEQARTPLLATSPLITPMGLVKHLAYVERSWFAVDLAGLDLDVPWRDDGDDADEDLRVGPGDRLADLLAFYDAECVRSREITASLSLDAVSHADDQPATLRWVLVHMIEETARHAGHLDLLREAIDGTKGD